jgi:hypothetical protein
MVCCLFESVVAGMVLDDSGNKLIMFVNVCGDDLMMHAI